MDFFDKIDFGESDELMEIFVRTFSEDSSLQKRPRTLEIELEPSGEMKKTKTKKAKIDDGNEAKFQDEAILMNTHELRSEPVSGQPMQNQQNVLQNLQDQQNVPPLTHEIQQTEERLLLLAAQNQENVQYQNPPVCDDQENRENQQNLQPSASSSANHEPASTTTCHPTIWAWSRRQLRPTHVSIDVPPLSRGRCVSSHWSISIAANQNPAQSQVNTMGNQPIAWRCPLHQHYMPQRPYRATGLSAAVGIPEVAAQQHPQLLVDQHRPQPASNHVQQHSQPQIGPKIQCQKTVRGMQNQNQTQQWLGSQQQTQPGYHNDHILRAEGYLVPNLANPPPAPWVFPFPELIPESRIKRIGVFNGEMMYLILPLQ
ncbi:hypothetical protein NL108_012545 [Boleophthalmus pectinirostris]|nr:hypothetical protein NL108_012545 [Boleophthalmus pectinirostris]